LLESLIKEQKPVTFDRAHFLAFADSSLDYEIVYYVESGDFNLYMDIQQSINLKIYEEFEKRGIEIAYPTRTLFIDNSGAKEDEEEAPHLLVGGRNNPEQTSKI